MGGSFFWKSKLSDLPLDSLTPYNVTYLVVGSCISMLVLPEDGPTAIVRNLETVMGAGLMVKEAIPHSKWKFPG